MASTDLNKAMKTVKDVFESAKTITEARVIAVANEMRVDRSALIKIVSVIRSSSDEAFSNGAGFIESALKSMSHDKVDSKKKK